MNNERIKEHVELVTDKTFRLTADRLVNKCGIRADLKGYDALADCVILYGTGAVTGFCDIYRAVGRLHGKSDKTIIREISYAIEQAFDIEGKLYDLIGIRVRKQDIHCSLLIAYLGKLFRNPDLSLYGSDRSDIA